MNDTKLRIKATNFAREWVEIMFNIRDTNWRRHSWKRDENRLDVWLLESTDTLESWIYVIKEATTTTNDRYFYLDKLTVSNAESFYSDDWFWWAAFSTQRESTKIQFDWDYKYMEYLNDNRVEQAWSIQDLLLKETDYYRIVRVFGVYCKTASSSSTLVNSANCGEASAPKEMRFCVKVFYSNNATKNTSELCSIMTNFTE